MRKDKNTDLLKELYETLQLRKRPEDVAVVVQNLLASELNSVERKTIAQASRNSLNYGYWGWSAMMDSFHKPVDMGRQIKTASEVFREISAPKATDVANPNLIEPYIKACGETLRRKHGNGDFLHGRLNKAERKAAGLTEISKRQYNKRFRLVISLEERLLRQLPKCVNTRLLGWAKVV